MIRAEMGDLPLRPPPGALGVLHCRPTDPPDLVDLQTGHLANGLIFSKRLGFGRRRLCSEPHQKRNF